METSLLKICYVSPQGSDENTGGERDPFRTVSRALAEAEPGTRILVRPGVYVERIGVPVSGMPGRPIVIEGVRTEQGGWETILDGSVPLATEWIPAPEVGPGVYRAADLAFEPHFMTVDGEQIPRIWPTHMEDGEGFKRLAYPSDKKVETVFLKAAVYYWDIIEAMYGYKDGTTYIRFRDGDDPNEKDLRAAPEGGMITIESQSHLVVKNLLVRGGQNGVLISGDTASHNVIENCRLVGGEKRVFITDGASHNHVRHNEITATFYGDRYRPGAWGGPRGDAAPYANRVKEHFYNEYKWFFGPNSTSDYGVRVSGAGPHNEIYGNHVSQGGQGIQVTRCSDALVYENTVHNFSSIGLICTLDRVENVQFYDNLVYDCNINLRIHHVNEPGQVADRTLCVYRNRFYQNPGVGSHIFMHYFEENDTEDYTHANVFIYHNSLSGGQNGISMSGYADDCGGLPNGLIVNNILSSRFSLSASRDFIRRNGMFGLFDFNWLGGEFKSTDPGHDYTHAPWYGRHNIFEAGAVIWDDAEMPGFVLPEQSTARDGGLDLSKPFSANGRQYGPLPGMSSGYFSGAGPDMGAVQYTK